MPTPFVSICPHCRSRLKLKNPDLIGRTAKCPACEEKFTVKKADSAPRPSGASANASSRRRTESETTPSARPKPPSEDEIDPWLKDDLDDFTDGAAVAPRSSARSAPPPVQGVRKKRKRSSSGGDDSKRGRGTVNVDQVAWVAWVVGGSIAGLLGASAWGAIAAFTFSEWGILAWAIGGFVGFGVRVAAREDDVGWAPGLTALGIAIAAVILGKFLAVHFMLASIEKMVGEIDAGEPTEMTQEETVDWIISDYADEIQYEWEEAGRTIAEPDWENIPDDAPSSAYYDPQAWSEAQSKWAAMSEQEQAAEILAYESGDFDLGGDFGDLKGELFKASFGLLDILFFFLAAVTAFKVGSGLDFGDD